MMTPIEPTVNVASRYSVGEAAKYWEFIETQY